MSKAVKKAELFGWLATVFQEPVESIHEDRSRESISGWDSMGMLMLMAELDEKLGVALDEDTIKRLRSVGDLVTHLREHAIAVEDA